MKAKEILRGGAFLSLTAFLLRTVGVSFNVYVSSKLGAAGMGLLSLVMSVYSLAVTFAVSGISLASIRLTAEAVGRGERGAVRRTMLNCLIYSAVFGTAAFAAIGLSAPLIAGNILGDARTLPSLRALAVSMPFISMTAAMQGYFTALRRVIKSAVTQFFEQFVKIAFTVTVLTAFCSDSIESACLAVVAGGTVGELASFFMTFILYLYDVRKNFGVIGKCGGLFSKITHIAIPVALSSYIRTGLVTLEHILIPHGLRRFGASYEQALSAYGVLQGMVLPIVLFPTAFLSSFNLLIVPEFAAAAARGEKRHINYMIGRVMRFTLLFAFGATAIMICFSHELGFVIYNSHDAADYIKIIAPLMPIMYFDSAVDSILKGLDEQLYNMKINIIDAASSAAMVYFLCPKLGILGYIITIFVSEIFNTACSVVRLINITGIKPDIFTWVVKPLICAVSACTIVRYVLESLHAVGYSYKALTIHILSAAAVYFLLLRLTHAVTSDDGKWVRSIASPKH